MLSAFHILVAIVCSASVWLQISIGYQMAQLRASKLRS